MSVTLEEAVKTGQIDIVIYLIENKEIDIHKNNDFILRRATFYGYIDIVKYLIKKGADIHIQNDYPLRIAINCGYYKITKYLIKKGANIHANNDEPLITAINRGYNKIVKYLIDKGVNKNTALVLSAEEERTLNLSIEEIQYEITEYLLIEGADIRFLCEELQEKYKYLPSIKLVMFLLDFHFKRETEFSENKLADCNVLKIVFAFI